MPALTRNMSTLLRLLLASTFLSFLAVFPAATAETIRGRIVGITDGDTAKILDHTRTLRTIRLAGIDAPEMRMPYGNRAKQHLANLVFGKDVDVEVGKADRYGRAVGKIIFNGQDINLAMIRVGMAWHYKQYQDEQSATDRVAYSEAEKDAKNARIGLWQDTVPVPPWEARRRAKGDERSSMPRINPLHPQHISL